MTDINDLAGKTADFQDDHSFTNADFANGYILAAGNHAIANGDMSPVSDQTGLLNTIGKGASAGAGAIVGAQLGSAFGLVGTAVGAVIGGVTGYDWRFTAATAVSGISQAVNSAVELTSIVPGDWVDSNPLNPHDIMKGYDDDLDKYYTEHQDGIDTAAFVATSLLPGLAGVKIYNKGAAMLDAAMAGRIGRNMEGATGLLGGMQADLLAQGTEAMRTSGAMFSFTDSAILGSIAAGAGEAGLQSMAFELGVQVGMNQSPLLKDQDYSDIAYNVLHAGLLGAGIGGVLHAATSAYSVKNVLAGRDAALRGTEYERGVQAGTPLDEQILAKYEAQFNLDTSVSDPTLEKLAAEKQVSTLNRLQDNIRGLVQKVNNDKDPQIANMFHEEVSLSSNTVQASQLILGLRDLSRLSEISPLEKELMKVKTKVSKALPITEEEQTFLDNHSVSYVKLWGEGAEVGSKVMAEAPKFTSIWDTLKNGQSIKVNANNIQTGNAIFKPEINKIHDIRKTGSVVESNARDIWSIHSGPLPDNHLIGEYDPALIRKAIVDLSNDESGVTSIRIQHGDGSISTLTSPVDAMAQLEKSIGKLNDHFIARSLNAAKGSADHWSTEAIASALNIKTAFLENKMVNEADRYSDLHAMQDYAIKYAKKVESISGKMKEYPSSILLRPQTIKAVYNTESAHEITKHSLPLEVYMKQKQALYRQDANVAATGALGTYAAQMPDIPSEAIRGITKNKIGGSSIAAANSDIGTLGSVFERIGHVINKAKIEATNRIVSSWDPIAYKLLGDTEASTEFAILQNKIQSMPDRYIVDAGSQQLMHRDYARFIKETNDGKEGILPVTKIDPLAPDVIPITSKKVYDTVTQHVALNDARLPKFNNIRVLNSPGESRTPGTVYFPNPDLTKYPYYAMVTDPSITGTGQMKMIYGATPEHLEKLISLVPEEFQAGIIRKPKVLTGPEAERWHKVIGDFKRAEVMDENYFDAALYRSGAAAPYIPQMDAKLVVDNLREWHIKQEHLLLREAVSLKYAPEFQELKATGDRDANIHLSAFDSRSLGKYAKETAAANPYMSYIRTALDIPATEEIPLRAFQNYLDEKISKAWIPINRAFSASTSVADLDKINNMVQASGLKTVNYDAINIALANHTIPRGALSTFTRRSNAILASVILKPDVLNAINNAVGMSVLLAPETHNLIEGIKAGDRSIAGGLADVSHMLIPGTENSYFSTTKLIHKAVKDFGNQANRDWLMARGISVRHSQEVSDMVDTLALTGREYALDLEGKITLAYDKAMRLGKWAEGKTGNSYAEEFTRGVSALVMKNLTDAAVLEGKLDPVMAESYIQTFVNRTNGNYLASQRPMMFNGPVGQSVGLFQTYMMNLMQQSLRHVAAGSTKSAALMTAMQGTIYGMASLPGFQQINSQLVGSFAGNNNHKDIYSAVYSAIDKNKADWLMYGALSNTLGILHPDLKINMYVRGDVNPRNVSIIPLNPADYPVATAGAKFFGNMYNTIDKFFTSGSGKTATLVQGLEHNGLSRPLSGLAQVLEAFTNPDFKSYSTNSNGSLVSANDFMSIINLARLTGAKPLDDAKAADEAFRQVAYKAREHEQTTQLGEVIKSRLVANQVPSHEEVLDFQKEYIKIGGSQEGFNKYWMNLTKDANVSQGNRLAEHLKTPEGQKMQLLMGGRKANDFSIRLDTAE